MQSLIIRYSGVMRTISATEASRRFSDLLDSIEAGESVVVTRGNRPIAEMRPAVCRTGRDLRDALAALPPPDEHLRADIAEALDFVAESTGTPWDDN